MSTAKKKPELHDDKRPAGEQAMGPSIYEQIQLLVRELTRPATPNTPGA